MTTSLQGQYVVLTGAAGFLGPFHARALLNAGAIPILLDIDLDRLKKLSEELSSVYSSSIPSYVCDITSKESISSVARDLFDNGIHPYGLVNNASIDPKVSIDTESRAHLSRFEDFSVDRWHNELDVCVTGALLCCQVFGESMVKYGRGVIVNISSDLSVTSPDQRLYKVNGVASSEQPVKPVSYVVAKTALHGLTRYLATYWADRCIRVNTLSPGGVLADQPDDFISLLADRIPLGRMALPDEISQSLIYLLSDASSYLTGFNLVVDGGRSSW